jgi:hypothetical protein
VVDEEANIVCCGDFCVGPNVQGAALSGLSAGEAALRLVQKITDERQQAQLPASSLLDVGETFRSETGSSETVSSETVSSETTGSSETVISETVSSETGGSNE